MGRGEQDTDRHTGVAGEDTEKADAHTPRREVPGEAHPVDTLVPDF